MKRPCGTLTLRCKNMRRIYIHFVSDFSLGCLFHFDRDFFRQYVADACAPMVVIDETCLATQNYRDKKATFDP